MKITARVPNSTKFSAPTVLRKDTPFLGATVGAWDAAMTGHMQEKLNEVKQIAATGPKRKVSDAKSFDVASIAGQLLAANAK